MCVLDARDYFVDGLQRRLPERIDLGRGHSSEVDRPSDVVINVM